jgi:hypothetical protein
MKPGFVTLAVALIAAHALAGAAAATSLSPPASSAPPGPPRPSLPGTVRAIVVRSWGAGSGGLVWEYLNQNWASYGTIPISIDSSTLHGALAVTLQDLEISNADVVIVSDPSGDGRQWSAADVAALQAYANEGHSLIGTYLLLRYGGLDNRALAPLFGLRSDLDYNSVEASSEATAEFLDPQNCLFSGIFNPLDQGGYPFVQVPTDGSWDDADVAGAVFRARGPSGLNVVTEYSAGNHRAYYISYMPEYQGGESFEATQWLYNAIVCPFTPTPARGTSWGKLKAIYR